MDRRGFLNRMCASIAALVLPKEHLYQSEVPRQDAKKYCMEQIEDIGVNTSKVYFGHNTSKAYSFSAFSGVCHVTGAFPKTLDNEKGCFVSGVL